MLFETEHWTIPEKKCEQVFQWNIARSVLALFDGDIDIMNHKELVKFVLACYPESEF